MKFKKIYDYAYQTKDGQFKCKIDKQSCIPGESSCSFTFCLSKLAWGLRTPEFFNEALSELEEFVGLNKEN